MSGTDSWIKMHICDSQGRCCESQKMHSIPRNSFRTWPSVMADDPCNGIILSKDSPGKNGQLLSVEHSGPDGTEIDFFNIFLTNQTYLRCKSFNHPTEKIVLPDNDARIVDLNCWAMYMI